VPEQTKTKGFKISRPKNKVRLMGQSDDDERQMGAHFSQNKVRFCLFNKQTKKVHSKQAEEERTVGHTELKHRINFFFYRHNGRCTGYWYISASHGKSDSVRQGVLINVRGNKNTMNSREDNGTGMYRTVFF
jgi:hypothetical protein